MSDNFESQVRELRSCFLRKMVSHPNLPEKFRLEQEKLYSIADSLEQIADMLARESPKMAKQAASIVDGILELAVKDAASGDKLISEMVREFVRERVKLGIEARSQTPDMFICHSTEDKAFVKQIANDISLDGFRVWYSDWELQIGDSLYEKIEKALASSRWFMIVLSSQSVESAWCKRELRNAYVLEDNLKRPFILPVLYEDCELPGFLKEKFWADCRGNSYQSGLKKILKRMHMRHEQ